MSPHFRFNQSTRLCVLCLVLVYSFQMAVAGGGRPKQLKVQNATKRQDNPLFDTLRKILPEDVGRIQAPANYLTVVLNASGVLGLGFLWIKEITNAIGTPILAPILMPPLLLLSACLLLIPDLSRIGELIDNLR